MKTEDKNTKPDTNHIDVVVVTASGQWPKKDYDRVASHQPVKVELDSAAKHLGILDTSNWVARVGEKEINITQNYVENGLTGKVEIDYGPRESGGG